MKPDPEEKLAGDMMKFAAALARGDYHPSDCVEDYRKGTGRVEFAAMAGDCADRCRAQVGLLRRCADALRRAPSGEPDMRVFVRRFVDTVQREDAARGEALLALAHDAEAALAASGEPEGERIYPCDDCGKMRTKADGGTVFTVCESCWDKRNRVAPEPEGDACETCWGKKWVPAPASTVPCPACAGDDAPASSPDAAFEAWNDEHDHDYYDLVPDYGSAAYAAGFAEGVRLRDAEWVKLQQDAQRVEDDNHALRAEVTDLAMQVERLREGLDIERNVAGHRADERDEERAMRQSAEKNCRALRAELRAACEECGSDDPDLSKLCPLEKAKAERDAVREALKRYVGDDECEYVDWSMTAWRAPGCGEDCRFCAARAALHGEEKADA